MSADGSSRLQVDEATCHHERREWESQEYRDFQAVVLSSNPACLKETIDPSTSNHQVTPVEQVSQLLPQDWAAKHSSPNDTERRLRESPHRSEDIGTAEVIPEPNQCSQEAVVEEETQVVLELDSEVPQQQKAIADGLDGNGQQTSPRVQRNSHGRIHRFDNKGRLAKRKIRESKTMEDGLNGTQKSSMSLTQENSESVYEGYNLQMSTHAQTSIIDSSDGRADVNDANLLPRSYPNHQSLVTDSTPHTYRENDTGHIRFDLSQLLEESEEQGEVSQDPSHVPAQFSGGSPYEPKTPAPAVNPFRQKGSVMKQQDLFGATQASSAVRAVLRSPTSSRPSPDTFNQFETPGLPSSPLQRGGVVNQSSQSPHDFPNSLLNGLLVASNSSQPFQTPGHVDSRGPYQPRPYRSIKESQERRRIQHSSDIESDDGGSDSSIDEVARHNKKTKLDERIHRELSAVAFRRPTSSRPPSSSAAAMVEVPSTSSRRRRSIQEDIPAEPEGMDASNSQQEEVVADSQNMPSNEPNPKVEAFSQPTGRSYQPQPKPSDHSHPSPKEHGSPQGAVLAYELPSNRNVPYLPVNSYNSQPANSVEGDTIPETSPVRRDRIRPMRDIASFSYSAEDEFMEDPPGFSQDVDFERALGRIPVASPRPMQRNNAEASLGLKSALKSRKDPIPEQMAEIARPSPKEPVANKSVKLTFESSPPHQDSREKIGSPEPSIRSVSKSPGSASKIGRGSISPQKKSTPDKAIGAELATPKEITKEDEPAPIHENPMQHDDPLPKAPTLVASPDPTSSALSSALSFEMNDEPSPTPPSKTQSDAENHTLAEAPLPDDNEQPLQSESGLKAPKRAKGPLATYARKTSRKSRRSPNLQIHTEDELSRSTPLPVQNTGQKTKESDVTRPSRSTVSTAALPGQTPSSTQATRKVGRKSVAKVNNEVPNSTRSSKRTSTARVSRESSNDPIALDAQVSSTAKTKAKGMFSKMAFAVSYVSSESDKNEITNLILENGGQILDDGFDSLFDVGEPNSATDLTELKLIPTAVSIGFVALVADKHSRRAKYMQALALGLPCLSGKWISACIAKCSLVDWSPYLLCAGQSSILEDAYRSRTLRPYSAADARLIDTLGSRDLLLAGKSILLVTGKGRRQEAHNAYVFLARALGPSRICQATDMAEARKKLIGSAKEGAGWDLVCVEKAQKDAEAALFDSNTSTGGSSRKRKRASSTSSEDSRVLKRVRVINNETVIQSLILGQLMDD